MIDMRWTPRTDAERNQWRTMCVMFATTYHPNSSATIDGAFDALVAPAPRVLRKVELSDGYTYQVSHGEVQRVGDNYNVIRVPAARDDIALINDLFENPYEPDLSEQPLTRQQCVEALVAMGAALVKAPPYVRKMDGGIQPTHDGATALILPREVTS